MAESIYVVELNGEGSSADVVSRSVAKGTSHQTFRVQHCRKCKVQRSYRVRRHYHGRCEDRGSSWDWTANDVDAALIHEAAIGKIAGEQLIKLMTLGLTEEEAESSDR